MHQAHQKGFSLLEVLISILVLSFGVLGAVGLQAASLQLTRESRLQSTGVQLADELSEILRSNHVEAIKTSSPYLIDSKTFMPDKKNITCGIPGSNNCTTSTSIATRDINDWLIRTKKQLPSARVVVCFDSTPHDSKGLPQWECSNAGSTLAIKIGWTRRNTLSGATGVDATDASDNNTGAFDKALRPSVVIPVNP
ncbi:MAG: type IV pilus modification protein PilV [Comamonas sp.]|nr:type IV pilus modification protein PilV [Comamonas sp.]